MATNAAHAATPAAAPPPAKKGKGKKSSDPVDTTKLLEQTMARLERETAGDREQEADIEREVKKANRDLTQQLSAYSSPLARADAIQKKYTKLYGDMKRLERENQKNKKRADTLQKEKDSAKSELNKTNGLKEKLEKLSRETNNENRKLRTDVQRLQDVEAKMREELHERLENLVLDVEDVINASSQSDDDQGTTYETDEFFKAKFRSFIDQYELRDLQFHSLLRQKELEIQAQLAMLEQQRRAQEVENSKSVQLTRQVSTFSQTETELRSQLNIYVEKFKQVEDTLNNSNDLFLTFRREMEEMSKKTKRLEKENTTLSRKHEATNNNILRMAEERTKMAEERTKMHRELELLRKKNLNLEKLCRGMQAQGRGHAASLPGTTAGASDFVGGPESAMGLLETEDEDGTESEYDDDEYDDDEEEGSEEEYDDDDTEEEAVEDMRRAFGPVPPPPPPPASASAQALANGAVGGTGVKGAVGNGKTRHASSLPGQLNGIKA